VSASLYDTIEEFYYITTKIIGVRPLTLRVAYCCRMGRPTAIKHPQPDRVKP